jgi:hypothetical protein
MANEIVGIDSLNFFFSYFEWTNNVIGFGQFVRILKDQWKW